VAHLQRVREWGSLPVRISTVKFISGRQCIAQLVVLVVKTLLSSILCGNFVICSQYSSCIKFCDIIFDKKVLYSCLYVDSHSTPNTHAHRIMAVVFDVK
jgi:hypothetical protein